MYAPHSYQSYIPVRSFQSHQSTNNNRFTNHVVSYPCLDTYWMGIEARWTPEIVHQSLAYQAFLYRYRRNVAAAFAEQQPTHLYLNSDHSNNAQGVSDSARSRLGRKNVEDSPNSAKRLGVSGSLAILQYLPKP